MSRIGSLISSLLVCGVLQAAEKPPAREQIEQDLVLKLSLDSPVKINAGGKVKATVLLRNQSKDKAYPIVMPGDGSELGWREPHVHFSAAVETAAGVSKSVPPAPDGRCGNFDDNWQKDTRLLKPGEEVVLKDWVGPPSQELDFQEAGRVHLVAHYIYNAGENSKGEKPAVPVAGIMAGVPKFELMSAPVKFEVVKPFELQLKVKKEPKAKWTSKLADVFDLHLVNRSGEPQELLSPASVAGSVLFEIQGQFASYRPTVDDPVKRPPGEKLTVKAGEELSFFGEGAFANGMRGTWTYPQAETVKVRASYHSIGVLRSEWVEVKVGAEE